MGIPVIKIFRSLILVILAYLSCQVWGYASMTVLIYTYDAGAYFHTDRNLNSDNQNYFYDGTANQYKPLGNLQGHSVDTKYQTTYFFAFVDGLFVTKSVKVLPSLQVPNAGGRIVSNVTMAEQTFFRVSSSAEGTGLFLTRVPPANRTQAIECLAPPPGNTAEFIQRVTVLAGTRLQRSRALPAFGRRGGREQFELLQKITSDSFRTGAPFR